MFEVVNIFLRSQMIASNTRMLMNASHSVGDSGPLNVFSHRDTDTPIAAHRYTDTPIAALAPIHLYTPIAVNLGFGLGLGFV